jgi:serine/threonine protein phosphatase PrpC
VALVLRYAARSDRGLIRGNNQDSVYAGPRLLAVADGMGGHAAGDVASKVVIAAMEHLDDDAPSGDMLQALREAVFDGSEHLREYIRERPQLEGMGTTLTAILFAGGRLALCHVGDSRAYLLRDGQLTQITHDDTFVQTLIDDGRITRRRPTATRSARCCCGPSTARTSSPTSPCARRARVTATCSAPTASPAS